MSELCRYLSMVNIILEKIISRFNSTGRGRGRGIGHFFLPAFQNFIRSISFQKFTYLHIMRSLSCSAMDGLTQKDLLSPSLLLGADHLTF